MLAMIGYAVAALVLGLGAYGVTNGVADAVEGMTRHSRSANIDQVYLEEQYDLIASYQGDGSGAGMMQAIAGGAQAALNAETLSTPDPAPVGMGFGTGITLGYAAGEITEEYLDPEPGGEPGPADTPVAPGFEGSPSATATSPGGEESEVAATLGASALAEVAGFYAIDPSVVGASMEGEGTITRVSGGITIDPDGSVSGVFSIWRERQDPDGVTTMVDDITLQPNSVQDVVEVQDGVYGFSVDVTDVNQSSRLDVERSDVFRWRIGVGMGELVVEGRMRFIRQ